MDMHSQSNHNLIMIKNRKGILLKFGTDSGGTFQWTCNILESLNNYAHVNKEKAYAFTLNCNDYDFLIQKYEHICFVRFSKFNFKLSLLLEKIYNKYPQLRFILSIIYPLNTICAYYRIEDLILPASLSVCLYRRRFIFMFCDISHKYYPNFPEIGGIAGINQREKIFNTGCKNSYKVIVESNELKNEVYKYYSINTDKIYVLYQCFSNFKSKLLNESAIELPKKFLFYPAQLWQHKNHKNLLHAFKILTGFDESITLVLTGFSKTADNEIFNLINDLLINNKIFYYGYVQEEDIVKLYKNAFALVMPTYFGPTNIPTLEAFYYGCPAVISNLPGVFEQAQDAALYFDPNDPKDIANKILLLNDNKLREKLILNGFRRSNELSFEGYYNKEFHIILNN
jgi:glycosyltransferase involved in cell wall biosynthesis